MSIPFKSVCPVPEPCLPNKTLLQIKNRPVGSVFYSVLSPDSVLSRLHFLISGLPSHRIQPPHTPIAGCMHGLYWIRGSRYLAAGTLTAIKPKGYLIVRTQYVNSTSTVYLEYLLSQDSLNPAPSGSSWGPIPVETQVPRNLRLF